jgi:hypothetical protein
MLAGGAGRKFWPEVLAGSAGRKRRPDMTERRPRAVGDSGTFGFLLAPGSAASRLAATLLMFRSAIEIQSR